MINDSNDLLLDLSIDLFKRRQEGHLAELRARVSGALGAESSAPVAAETGDQELLETVLAEAPKPCETW